MPLPTTVPARSVPPRWVRIVDMGSLLIVILGVIVAISGGFRLHAGSWHLSIFSPYRVFAFALAVQVVRHVCAPRFPVYRDLPGRILRGWRSPGVATAGAIVAGTRPAMLLVGYFAVLTLGYAGPGVPPLRISDDEIVNLPARWDGGWYMGIVVNGYGFEPAKTDQQQNIVFFPAYPMLVRAVGRVFGGEISGYSFAGEFVSIAAFFGALVYLFRLARELLPGMDENAVAGLWLLATYPFALFFSAYYTESLYLLGVAGAFYHFTRRDYWTSAVWGLLVGLSRPNGFFLAVPLATIAAAPFLPAWLRGGRQMERPDFARWAPLSCAILAPIVGMLCYAAYIGVLTGDPLAWVAGHIAWGRRYSGFGSLVSERYDIVSASGFTGYVRQLPYDFANAAGALFVLATAWPVARRLGLPYALFILINMLPPLAEGGFLSAGRFSAVLFPAFIWLGSVLPKSQRPVWLSTFMALQALGAALFYTWHPLF